MQTMNWILRNRRRALRRLEGEGGFTIVELMVAISIFAILMAAAALSMNGALNMTRNNRSRSVAANLASQEMDSIEAKDFNTIPVGQSPATTQTIDGVVYTLNLETEWVSPSASTSNCAGGIGADPAYLRVTVSVTWPQMNGVLPVQSQTVITPPVGTYDANSGNIAVSILDRNAGPQQSMPVTVTDTSGNATTLITTKDGCAFFAYLAPGKYTVSVHVDGYVNDQRQITPTTTVVVVAGSTVTAQFSYDLESELDVTMVGAAGGTVPDGVPMTIANTGLLPNGLMGIVGTGRTGPSRAIQGLFPFLSGYQVWAGQCLDADPQGINPTNGQPYYPGATRDPAFGMTPGATTTGNVNVPSLSIQVLNGAGLPVVGAQVQVVHAPDPVNGCTAGLTLTLKGTTDSTGTISAALPFGQWQLQVVSKTPVTSWPTVTLAPPAGGNTATVKVN